MKGREMAARTLGQVIAVERATRQQDNNIGAELLKLLPKEEHFKGLRMTYRHFDEAEAERNAVPDEYQAVHLRVEDVLDEIAEYSSAALDITATKDRTNCDARADIIIDGVVIVPEVPISHLLFLQDYFTEWGKTVKAVPVLNPARNWTPVNGEPGLFAAEPEKVTRKLKNEEALELYPATKEHPAQVKTTIRETPVGEKTTTMLSGAVTSQRKKELLTNLHKLLLAVKDAIARANRAPVTEISEGEDLMKFLLGR
jgi:hypothetical protein